MPQCNGTTTKGQRCKNNGTNGGYCHLHVGQATGTAARTVAAPARAAAQRGATASARPAPADDGSTCIALTATGTRCTFRAKFGAFCGTHNNMVLRGHPPPTIHDDDHAPLPAEPVADPWWFIDAADDDIDDDTAPLPAEPSINDDDHDDNDDPCRPPCRPS